MEFGGNRRCLSRSELLGRLMIGKAWVLIKDTVPDLSNTRTSARRRDCLLHNLLDCSVADHRHSDREGGCVGTACPHIYAGGRLSAQVRNQSIRLADGSIIAFPYIRCIVELPRGCQHFSAAWKIEHLIASI
jgi:hypothetical protein